MHCTLFCSLGGGIDNNMEDNRSISKQSFTRKHLAVISLLLEGKSNKQIALQLGVSTRAVEYHLNHIYKKLGVSCRAAAAMKLARLFEK